MQPIPIYTLPATCELCGEWMPNHASTCPRNGVHPSQWSASSDEDSTHSQPTHTIINFQL
ncbi:hypothetical protein CU097_004913 [Rhizopus azygosporus]|uniref:Uncharacterized protein n=2 Tax=Rhizopus TaxID=4842 RepID=A0A367K0M2_RHIAZ|nr:hypothetical protein BCV71DRAFT_77794 [Rhizopus microsporus]RCH95792.1 hypothetical protein CU097_004913 [Rhizopus azygosporus]